MNRHSILEAIQELDSLETGRLLQAVNEIAEIADQLAGQTDADHRDDFLNEWYGDAPGYFWLIFDKTTSQAPSESAWYKYGILRMIKDPADHYIDLGMLAEDKSKEFELLRKYFEVLATNATDDRRHSLVQFLWAGRNEGIKTSINENWLKKSPPHLKPLIGQKFNDFSKLIEEMLKKRPVRIRSLALTQALERERVDFSLPGVIRPVGSRHLIRQVFQEIEDIFFSIGFSVVEGPEIETPYYNFEALNIPEFHPVRDDMDTFYIDVPASAGKQSASSWLLRTHTSPVQIRTMEKTKPPVRVIVPGKVYRRDNPDATHSFMFHQIEGLAVDSDITFCDFTGTIEYFVKQFFGPGVKTRFRPSYFPFTEPSVEFDASCIFCNGTGSNSSGVTCSKCKGSGWIELFGAGMVDPAVYGFVNYDPKKVSGFAFGIGIDRLAMLKYGIDDIQVFFQNDVRFLRQFP
jgi:phenylalanyl-tRNA synthetase alpha chain